MPKMTKPFIHCGVPVVFAASVRSSSAYRSNQHLVRSEWQRNGGNEEKTNRGETHRERDGARLRRKVSRRRKKERKKDGAVEALRPCVATVPSGREATDSKNTPQMAQLSDNNGTECSTARSSVFLPSYSQSCVIDVLRAFIVRCGAVLSLTSCVFLHYQRDGSRECRLVTCRRETSSVEGTRPEV